MNIRSQAIGHFNCDQGRPKPKKAMDHSKYPNPRVHNHLQSHNSKRMIKFLLSLSVLSVLFSFLPLLLQSFKPFFMQQFFSHTVDKSYMFLLCNGLMVFIGMSSGLINASSPTDNQSVEVAVCDDNDKNSRLEFNASENSAPIAGENIMAIESPQEEENSLMIAEQENPLSDAQEDEEKSLMILEEEEEEEDTLLDAQEDEEEGHAITIIDADDHGHVAEDTEELNKKCEDFIRKMKAAFISEPLDDHCLPVLVN